MTTIHPLSPREKHGSARQSSLQLPEGMHGARAVPMTRFGESAQPVGSTADHVRHHCRRRSARLPNPWAGLSTTFGNPAEDARYVCPDRGQYCQRLSAILPKTFGTFIQIVDSIANGVRQYCRRRSARLSNRWARLPGQRLHPPRATALVPPLLTNTNVRTIL